MTKTREEKIANLRKTLVNLVEVIDTETDGLTKEERPALACLSCILDVLGFQMIMWQTYPLMYLADEEGRGNVIECLDASVSLLEALTRHARSAVELERAR